MASFPPDLRQPDGDDRRLSRPRGHRGAAIVVSSNSQVASNTISGHKPPSGKHANLIVGSVNGQDIAADSLTGLDISEPSLTGVAHKLLFAPSGTGGPTVIASVGPWSIEGSCDLVGGLAGTTLEVFGAAGTADVIADSTLNDATDLGTSSARVSIPADNHTQIIGAIASSGESKRTGGTAMIRSGSTLVQVDFNIVTDFTSGGGCFIYGTATRAT